MGTVANGLLNDTRVNYLKNCTDPDPKRPEKGSVDWPAARGWWTVASNEFVANNGVEFIWFWTNKSKKEMDTSIMWDTEIPAIARLAVLSPQMAHRLFLVDIQAERPDEAGE